MLNLVGPTEQLGEFALFNTAPEEYSTFYDTWGTCKLGDPDYKKIFKKDLFVDSIVEKLTNVTLYYIKLNSGRGDELVYFRKGNNIFHGEKVWSSFHPFIELLETINPSVYIEDPAVYVGSKNNFTHQLVDSFPSLLLYQKEIQSNLLGKQRKLVFGSSNKILDQLINFISPEHDIQLRSNNIIWLNSTGKPYLVGDLSITAIHFNDILIVKHISIFKSFELLSSFFAVSKKESKVQRRHLPDFKIGYLSRPDLRVVNNIDLKKLINERDGIIIGDIQENDFQARIDYLSSFSTLVLPPGSDNINAFCFSSDRCKFIQLVSVAPTFCASNPFYSFAGYRYMLPFLDRIHLLPCVSKTGLHEGLWDPHALEQLLLDCT